MSTCCLGTMTGGHLVTLLLQQQSPQALPRQCNHYGCGRGVSLWIKWLVNEAGGGPSYGPDTVHQSMWDDSGRLKRRQLLDRHSQHTAHCSSCSEVRRAST